MKEALKKAQDYIAAKRGEVNPFYRQAYHLMAPVGWINDPNGFVYYRGEYHLFYQYHPYASQWGPMHWGHAKSKDLIHWEELPVALAPSEVYDRDGCFSGSALVKDDQLILMYTGFVNDEGRIRQTQCIATSSNGITFEKSPANPVLSEEHITGVADIADFRDPKILAHDGHYYAVVAAKTADKRGQVLLFESEGIENWRFKSVLLTGRPEQGIMWECPDLFFLDGKWVLLLSPIEMEEQGVAYHNLNSTLAFVGEMDWEMGQFVVEGEQEIDGGLDFYAPQTCQNERGERVLIAWMQMWHRTMPTAELGHGWAGTMTLPRLLSLKNARLAQTLVPSLTDYLALETKWSGVLEPDTPLVLETTGQQELLQLELDSQVSWDLHYPCHLESEKAIRLSFDHRQKLLTLSRQDYGLEIVGKDKGQAYSRSIIPAAEGENLLLELVRDTVSLEVFVNQEQVLSTTVYEEEVGSALQLQADTDLRIQKLILSRVECPPHLIS